MIEAMESNVARCDLLKSRGYAFFPGYFIHRHKPLDPAMIEPVNLPPGFSIKPFETDEDRRCILRRAGRVRSATVEQDEFLKQAPSYVPELICWCGRIKTRSLRSARCGSIPSTTMRSLNRSAPCRVFRSVAGRGAAGACGQSSAREGLPAGHGSIVEHVGRREQVVSGGGAAA